MHNNQIECLIGPQKADIIRRFLPAFRKSSGLRRSPDLDGFFRLALRRAKADGYDNEDLIIFAKTGDLPDFNSTIGQAYCDGHSD